MSTPSRSTVAVIVLGDVGRSPRMQYHAHSLASLPHTDVALIGCRGERCFASVEDHPRITQHLMSAPFARAPRALWLLVAPLKVLHQVFTLLFILFCRIRAPRAILVQNPPSIPTLAIALCAARLRGARLIIDWHNFGYSILALARGPRHPLVRFATVYERCFGRAADANLCVTNAMRLWLAKEWRIRATVLYDRPPVTFRPTSVDEKHALLARLASVLALPDGWGGGRPTVAMGRPPLSPPTAGGARRSSVTSSGGGGVVVGERRRAASVVSRTALTEMTANGSVRLAPLRPALLVSSTSWTADEDLGMLLDALEILDVRASAAPNLLPYFLVVITGKGPGRAEFEARAAKIAWRRVAVRCVWLEQGDYPLLLGAADAGISLHASSSGLDLPMKVVDMHGAGLPVLALNFACLPELVRHQQNGLVFISAQQLARQLEDLFSGFPDEPSAGRLGDIREKVLSEQERWDQSWRKTAAPLLY